VKKQSKALTEMKIGQSGTVAAISGGSGMRARLEALGVRIGSKITKKSALIGLGPVIAVVGNMEIAIGYGMASRIFVEVDEQ